ncbi:hypothetical protein [Cohnella panacarvi]|uniref:hypothetical protein n=1 Tax=Cohnella panacarvi TaxID=400776 RepID=UPI00047DF631|nr:hypothetical protein [Cohnella panacarvi]
MSIFHWRSYGLLFVLGIAAIVGLSGLNAADDALEQRRAASAVFEPLHAKMLRDDNLIDEMADLSARVRLLRVRWDHGILAVDLAASAPADLWLDAKSLITFAFKDKNNVGQLLIRVFNGNNEDHVLLSSIETLKSDWADKQIDRLRPTDLELDQGVASRIRMTVTPAGERWKRNFAN